jgi:hypothetical protein
VVGARTSVSDLASQWREESIEKTQHADKLIDRIIFLGGFPDMQSLDPLHIGQNVKEVADITFGWLLTSANDQPTSAISTPVLRDFRIRTLRLGRGKPVAVFI